MTTDHATTRARLLREYTAERIDDANAADYVRQPYREGFPTRERVAHWNREWLELERCERGLTGVANG